MIWTIFQSVLAVLLAVTVCLALIGMFMVDELKHPIRAVLLLIAYVIVVGTIAIYWMANLWDGGNSYHCGPGTHYTEQVTGYSAKGEVLMDWFCQVSQ